MDDQPAAKWQSSVCKSIGKPTSRGATELDKPHVRTMSANPQQQTPFGPLSKAPHDAALQVIRTPRRPVFQSLYFESFILEVNEQTWANRTTQIDGHLLSAMSKDFATCTSFPVRTLHSTRPVTGGLSTVAFVRAW